MASEAAECTLLRVGILSARLLERWVRQATASLHPARG